MVSKAVRCAPPRNSKWMERPMADTTPTIPDSARPTEIRFGEGTLWQNIQLQVDARITPEMILIPDLYTHIAERISPGDKIIIASVAGTFFAEVLVRSTTRTSCTVALLHQFVEPLPAVLEAGGLRVVWKGGPSRWALELTASGETVREKYFSRTEAAEALTVMTAARGGKGAKAAA
jgi:hypothetical protein